MIKTKFKNDEQRKAVMAKLNPSKGGKRIKNKYILYTMKKKKKKESLNKEKGKQTETDISDRIYEQFDKQLLEIAEEIADWNERSVLVYDGKKFSVIHDFGNTDYHYSQDIHSPNIVVKTFSNVLDTTEEDDFWSLLNKMDEKGVRRTPNELRAEIKKEGGIVEVAKKYDVDIREVRKESAEAEIEQYLNEHQHEIVEAAEKINKEIEAYKKR